MKYLLLLFVLILLSFYMIAVALSENTFIPCTQSIQQSGPLLKITEVAFDGSDERIEITNIGSDIFSGTITLSGVKSTPLTYTIMLDTLGSIIIGDTLSSLTGDLTIVSGQGFSLSDTTGFTISILQDTTLIHEVYFTKDDIIATPNNYGLHSIVSGNEIYRIQTSGDTINNTITPLIANPGIVYCSHTQLPSEDILTGTIDETTGEATIDILSGDVLSGDENILHITGYNEENSILQDLPCDITEIHTSEDIYPEYIEMYCATPFSGYISSQGLGVGETIKTILLVTDGGYTIVASSFSGFSPTTSVITLQSLSLKDDGETILLFASGYISGSITFPSLETHKTYYPENNIQLPPTPGFHEMYIMPYLIQATEQPPIPYLPQPSPTTGTYYSLYQKRKTTAEEYKVRITTLTKEKTTLIKDITSLQKQLLKLSQQKNNSVSSAKTTKAAISVTGKATSTPKTTTKPPSIKGSTISTTSKSYQKLVNEHKLYDVYIDYIHTYLKTHLYKQYSTLGIDSIDKRLQTSLKAVRNNQLTLSGSTGTVLSVFDYIPFTGDTYLSPSSIGKTFISLGYSFKQLYHTLFDTLFLAKGAINNTLIQGQKQSDIGNDTTGIKISETNFLPLE